MFGRNQYFLPPVTSSQLVDHTAIAVYLAEKARGLQHTRAYTDKMNLELAFGDEVKIREFRARRNADR